MSVKSDEDDRVYNFRSSMTFCGQRETGDRVFCQGHGYTYQGKLNTTVKRKLDSI